MYSLLQMTLLSATAAVSASALPQVEPSGPGNPNYVCPADDMAATHCRGPKDCLYSQPGNNCNGYIQCVPADDTYTTGIAYLLPCPAGLLWNDGPKWCDWAHNANCSYTPITIRQSY